MRKLLPESWGFLCPVHTPDGSPCGLLSHFTAMAAVVASPPPDGLEEAQHAIATVGPLLFYLRSGVRRIPVLNMAFCQLCPAQS